MQGCVVQRSDARCASGNPLQAICGAVPAGMNGILSTREEFARVASNNGPRRNAIAARAGRLTRIGMSMNEQLVLKIDGMHCDGCVRRVTSLIKKVNGALVEEVVVGSAKVNLTPGTATLADLVRAVESGGFSVRA